MVEHFKAIVSAQLEASLCMLHQCILACPNDRWEEKIANGPARWVAYHTLFFTDVYLSADENAFQVRDLHARGGNEFGNIPAPGLTKEESLIYCQICCQKVATALAAETAETLAGPSGFSWCRFSRAELYLYNLRHIQHHTGQLSAFVRKNNPAVTHESLLWIGSGWRAPNV